MKIISNGECYIQGRDVEHIMYNNNDFTLDLYSSLLVNGKSHPEKDEYIKLLNDTAEANGYHFIALFVTDIIKNGSYVLYSDRAEDVLRGAYKNNKLTEGTFLKGVVSRKKQVLPGIMLEMGE